MKLQVAVSLALLFLACGATEPQKHRAAPGEEPLETASLPDEEIVPLEPEKSAPVPAHRRPCGWAKAWTDPSIPDPLLAGVGGVPTPEKIESRPLALPVRKPSPAGEIVVEMVVSPEGRVLESAVVRTTEPPWPEAERAIQEAVKGWSYEPPKLDGTPVAVCTTIVIRP